jgi:uncharacterized membrane protein
MFHLKYPAGTVNNAVKVWLMFYVVILILLVKLPVVHLLMTELASHSAGYAITVSLWTHFLTRGVHKELHAVREYGKIGKVVPVLN